jgi:hypothetical membrane protein
LGNWGENDRMIRRIGGWAGAIGPSLFVLVFLIEGWLRPGYDPAADYVSALSLGARGWVQVTSFMIVGVCLLLFTAAVSREFLQGAALRGGPLLLTSIGVGLLLSGPFVMDPAGTPPAAMSWHGLIHGVLGAIVFVLMPIVCFVYLKRFGRDARWRGLWPATLVLGTITAVADLVFTLATKVPALVTLTTPWAGILQRLVLIPFMAWVAVFASGLIRRTR